MWAVTGKSEALRQLERDVLRNIVLLKHLHAFPEHSRPFCLGSDRGLGALVLLDARVSDYDRATYPKAAHVVLINSDEPTLARKLLTCVPQGGGVVFKLSSDEDRDVVSEKYCLGAGRDISHSHLRQHSLSTVKSPSGILRRMRCSRCSASRVIPETGFSRS